MATITEIRNTPLSGAIHIDALLDRSGLNWAYVTDIPFNTIRYSFSLAGHALPQSENVAAGSATEFSAVQQAATRSALAYLSELTGIAFVETATNLADVHFANASILSEQVVGSFNWRAGYAQTASGTVTQYEIDGVVYLDNDEYQAYNATLNPGSQGYETLLHELGHMLGLKHPFEEAIQLPDGLDTTANTLMSYDSSGQVYSTYRDFDRAALAWLYGGDGVGGLFGVDAQGRILVGTGDADQLTASAGMDRLQGLGGNDTLDGGAGLDHALYAGARAGYQVGRVEGGFSVTGGDGADVLRNTERLAFDDVGVALDVDGTGGAAYRLYQAAFDRTPDAGGVGYWMAVLDAGAELRNVAANFLASDEFASLYGASPDNETLLGRLYQNILHRAPDQGGFDYWLDVLDRGGDRAAVLMLFSEGFENKGTVAATIGNGFDYIPYA